MCPLLGAMRLPKMIRRRLAIYAHCRNNPGELETERPAYSTPRRSSVSSQDGAPEEGRFRYSVFLPGLTRRSGSAAEMGHFDAVL
jgi:hypothetical protein